MNILGINAYHGDAAAVVLADGKLLYACEEERLNRVKHSAGLPEKAFEQALEKTGVSPEDVDYVAISRDPAARIFSKLSFVLKNHPPLSFLKDRLKVSSQSGNVIMDLKRRSGVNGKFRAGSARVEHHLSHAASAYYPSGFDRAALLTVDGFGDFSSVMFGLGEGNKIKVLKRILFPHSLGVLYTAATQYLGFPKYGDEYKVMGLAGFGEPRFLKQFRELIHLEQNGLFKLDLDYFVHQKGKTEMTWEEGEPILGPAYSEKWKNLFGPPRRPEEPLTQRDKDMAASAQAVFEETFFHLLKDLHQRTRLDTLCLAGGCAFNSVANGKIFDHSPFKNVYIQPAAGDAGTALGSALYVWHHRLGRPRNFVMEHAYWGPEFGGEEISEELNRRRIVILSEAKDPGSFGPPRSGPLGSGLRMTCQRIKDEAALCQKTAQAIAEGKIVGWFQGRMEWGPRALGNRSTLADPRRVEMRDTLNERIKFRETFRPFAPSVLEEKANKWFEMKTSTSPFMNLVFRVQPEKKPQIPAVTHVDGTARVHTVSKEANPLFWNLIHEFEKISGVPMLLNTSFNENEPIVCRPEEAIGCFLRTRMDILVMGNYFLQRIGVLIS